MTHRDLDHRKATLRLKARAARRAISPEMRHAASALIARRVLDLPELATARAVAAYGAMPEEVDTAGLIEELMSRGVRVALPRVVDRLTMVLHWHDRTATLLDGAFSVKEPHHEASPAPVAAIDVFVIPGVAFDARCNRLGMGGGYYDRLLGGLDTPRPVIGLAFDEQVFDELPVAEHDRPVDVLVTPTRVLRRAPRPL